MIDPATIDSKYWDWQLLLIREAKCVVTSAKIPFRMTYSTDQNFEFRYKMATSSSSNQSHCVVNDIDLFLDCLTSSLQEETLKITTKRNKNILDSGTLLRERILDLKNGDDKRAVLKKAQAIVRSVRNVTDKCGKPSSSKYWVNVCENFHRFREGELVKDWEDLADSLAVTFDPILIQSTTENILLSLSKTRYSSLDRPERLSRSQLTLVEECAVMYCGGYVVNTLVKSLRSSKEDTSVVMVTTLESLCEERLDSTESDSEEFEDFVKKWMHTVDRGGLFILKDEAFHFFKLLELLVYSYISQQSSMGQVHPDSIVKCVIEDIDLQFQWCMLATDLDKHASDELLASIATVWIKVRGHSHAAALVEKYKWATAAEPKKGKRDTKSAQVQLNSKDLIIMGSMYL